MDIRFSTYNDFLTEYQTYKLDKCSNCEGVREVIDDDVTVVIENRTLHFPELLVLCCNKCGDKCLPEYSKQIIDGAYKSMIEQEQFVGEFVSKSYKKKFEYCKETDYKYMLTKKTQPQIFRPIFPYCGIIFFFHKNLS